MILGRVVLWGVMARLLRGGMIRSRMAADRDANESFSGIRVELPFASVRVGRGGWGLYQASPRYDDAYERARQRVRARLSFYRHVATYAAVIGALLLIDLVTGGGLWEPLLWFAGIWGAFLVWQGFNVFVFPSVWSEETEERMIEQELQRHQR